MFLKTRNLFLQIALRVSDTISAYELTEDHVIIGLEDYMVVIRELGLDASSLQTLYDEIKPDA